MQLNPSVTTELIQTPKSCCDKSKMHETTTTKTRDVTRPNGGNVKLSLQISGGIGNTFYRLGFLTATHPVKTVILSLIFTLICSSGYLNFRTEKNPLKLWIPQDSNFLHDTNWLMKSFEEGYREQTVLLVADNVLEPHVLQKLLLISEAVSNFRIHLNNGTDYGLADVCFKIPIVAFLTTNFLGRKRRFAENSFDDDEFDAVFENKEEVTTKRPRPFNPSVDLHKAIFCGFINNLPTGCMLNNILELWDFNKATINSLTKDDILNALNERNISRTTGHEANFQRLLSGIQRNETGHIVAATSLLSNWMIYVNFSNVNHEKVGNMAGTEDWASEEALIWESEFLATLASFKHKFTDEQVDVYYSAGRSFGDISAATMFQDMGKISLGSILMFIYMQLILSKFSWTEIRIGLCGLGLLSVGIAFISAVGVCSFLGIPYGPVHTSLPFLLMGLGVDDIFVLMACWRKLQHELGPLKSMNAIPDRLALMLKTAGTSITITSFTDIVAFSIGSFTVLPSLQSFCRYAAFGVFFTWLFAITFFIAIFAIDERRILSNRNSFLPFIIHKPVKTNLRTDQHLLDRILKFIFTKCILTKPGKIIVIMSTIGMTAFSISGLLKLEQKFDPVWFIPSGTYLNQFIMEKRKLYPDQGNEASILMGQLNYTNELRHIRKMISDLENRTDLVYEMTNWVMPFHDFVLTYHEKNIFSQNFTDMDFRTYLTQFLWSPTGGKYQANIRFERKLECGEPSPNIVVSTINFKYKQFNSRNDYVPAMHSVHDIVKDADLSSGDGFSTVWGKVYGNWVTDEVIDTELIRNVVLALISVMICTLLLIVDIHISFWIFVCIILTLINVCGSMETWGLTIDLVSCIGLQLAVGLCVDYAAHIGHTFLLMSEGSRSDRAQATVLHIGPAVLNGGISTILAMSMLANSDAYTFKAFFKIFLLVISFGLYFGVVFLPVVLSLIGPKAYQSTFSRTGNPKSLEADAELTSFVDDTATKKDIKHDEEENG